MNVSSLRPENTRHFARITLCLIFTLASLCVRAQDLKSVDPIADQFYPPELLQKSREALGLSAEQEAALQEAMEKVQTKAAGLQERLQAQRAKLVTMAKEERLNEDAIVHQASRVMDLERDVKMAHLVLLVKIKNILTPEQQAKLQQFKEKMPALQAKIRQAQELVEKWKHEGRDISPFDRAREEFKRLMEQGSLNDAEKLLDKALEQLKAPRK